MLALPASGVAMPVEDQFEDSLKVYVSQPVGWGVCDRPEFPVAAEVECARLRASVDWGSPRGETVELQAYRLKATSAKNGKLSRGTIAIFLSWLGGYADEDFSLLRKLAPDYDFISLDSRGWV